MGKQTKVSRVLRIAVPVAAVALLLGLWAWASFGKAAGSSYDSALDVSSLFTNRDQRQTADLTESVTYTVSDGSDISITEAGVYVLTGSAQNVTVCVEAGDEDKVQLVLDGLEVVNDDFPVIYVKNADKVFLTTAENSKNSLSVTGSFIKDGSKKTGAVVFCRDDLVLNGLGSLTISSSDDGICGKDGIKVTGGTLNVTAADCAIVVNDFFAMSDGSLTLSAQNDGIHTDNSDDNTLGWIYFSGGSVRIDVSDDGLHAASIAQIDGGKLQIAAAEGVEATWVQINGGELTISATGDGINGAWKSSAYSALVEINGGALDITVGEGDTDGVDSNGDLTITGGTVRVNAQSAFDWDGTLTWTGGTVIVNGAEVTEITNQLGAAGKQ